MKKSLLVLVVVGLAATGCAKTSAPKAAAPATVTITASAAPASPAPTVTVTAMPPASSTAPSQSAIVYVLTGTIVVNAATARSVTYRPPDAIFTNSDNPTCASKRDDIQAGTVITVRDENGTIIGTGDINTSKWINTKNVSAAGISGGGEPPSVGVVGDCELGLTVPGLPSATFYTVQIGVTTQNISLADMQRSGWNLSMDLRTYS